MRFGYTSLINNWPNNPHRIQSLQCETQNALIQCAVIQMNNYVIKNWCFDLMLKYDLASP